MVIPAMDHIDETLTSQLIDPEFEPSLQAAHGLAKKTLNHYYSATDHSDVYRIAMGTSFNENIELSISALFMI
jgi:hypothetical protein